MTRTTSPSQPPPEPPCRPPTMDPERARYCGLPQKRAQLPVPPLLHLLRLGHLPPNRNSTRVRRSNRPCNTCRKLSSAATQTPTDSSLTFYPSITISRIRLTRCRTFLALRKHSNLSSQEEVSKQIARLFKDDPDLRADFRIFMPERNRQVLEDVPSSSRSDKAKHRKAEPVNATSILPQKRKRKAVEKEIVEIIPKAAPKVRSLLPHFMSRLTVRKAKKVKHTPAQDLTPSSYKSRASPPPNRRHPGSRAPAATTVLAAAPEDSHAHVFFDRVKRYLDDSRETYNEFLKLVNLFTQDFIDTARLIKESRNFLGDSELLNMLREIVGWDERKEKEYWMEEQAAGNSWVRPTIIGWNASGRTIKAESDAQFGSYRKIPASVRTLVSFRYKCPYTRCRTPT